MKHWKCKWCGRERDTQDNCTMAICNTCIEAMIEIKEGDGYGHSS